MTTERRQEQLEDFHGLETKVDKLVSDVAVLASKFSDTHADQHEYIQKAMAREARREALHQAIIEKTFLALIWAFMVGFGKLIWDAISTHWK
jgi:hypothetical protein